MNDSNARAAAHRDPRRPAAGRRPMPGPQKEPSTPRAPVVSTPRAEVVSTPRAEVVGRERSIAAIPPANVSLARVPVEKSMLIRAEDREIAKARGYQRQDLYAIAEIAHHYLFSGGTQIAQALYEGLVAVAPDEAYFALGLGLTYDHLGDTGKAERCYKRAGDLDPHDPRPDVNRAELYVERRDFQKAKELLARGAKKAAIAGDLALEKKATALYNHLGRR